MNILWWEDYLPAVRGWLRRKYPDLDVEVVLQETRVCLIDVAAGTVRENKRGYVFRTASHIASRMLGAKQAAAMDAHDLEDLESPAPGPLALVSSRDEWEFLVRPLPARQRNVLTLRFVDGLSVREVANLLRVSDETVKLDTAKAIMVICDRQLQLRRTGGA
jgi:RNA polymerase sigma factor (sigma-70 family)